MEIPSGKLAILANEHMFHTVKQSWDVRSEQPLPERLAKTALCAAFRIEPVRKQLYRTFDKQFPGYRHIGGGKEQAVFSNGDSVLKLLVTTAFEEVADTNEGVAANLQARSDTCEGVLGNIWTSTSFGVVNPVRRDEMVVARQPHITPLHAYGSLDQLVGDETVDPATKVDFASRITKLHDATGMYPDLFGSGNIFAVAGLDGQTSLKIVDTIPIAFEDQQKVWPNEQLTLSERTIRGLDALAA